MKIAYCLMAYFSVFTGLIFTFSVNLARINARNNTQPLYQKHILPNPDYLLFTKKNNTNMTFLYSLLSKSDVERLYFDKEHDRGKSAQYLSTFILGSSAGQHLLSAPASTSSAGQVFL